MLRPLDLIALLCAAGALLAGCAGQTDPAQNVAPTTATLEAHGHSDSTPAHYEFQYATAPQALGTGFGFQTPTRGPVPPNVPGGGGNVPFGETVTGLKPRTTYYYRVCGGDGQIHPDTCANVQSFATLSQYALYGTLPLSTVDPDTTSGSIGAPNDPEYYGDPGANDNGKLVVFLPGTGSYPVSYRKFMELALTMGFHVIGLTYDDTPSVHDLCGADLSCYGPVRENLFNGSPPPPGVSKDVPPANAIGHRLTSLLGWLVANDPAGNWAQFDRGGSTGYLNFAVAGLSQGGGEAAFIAKQVQVAGALMFSSIDDSLDTAPYTAATWVSSASVTPLKGFVGFDDTQDPAYPKITSAWQALGLPQFGAEVSVDTTLPPFNGTHQLSTADVPPGQMGNPHDAPVYDPQTPSCSNGRPRFLPVWTYMLDVVAGFSTQNIAQAC